MELKNKEVFVLNEIVYKIAKKNANNNICYKNLIKLSKYLNDIIKDITYKIEFKKRELKDKKVEDTNKQTGEKLEYFIVSAENNKRLEDFALEVDDELVEIKPENEKAKNGLDFLIEELKTSTTESIIKNYSYSEQLVIDSLTDDEKKSIYE